ncbi:MAG: cell cycle histidine kinase CckA [Alphaproteobacteria bacterium]
MQLDLNTGDAGHPVKAGMPVTSATTGARSGRPWLVSVVALALVITAGAYLVLPGHLANFIVLICLGVLASIGVVSLFAAAGGLLHLDSAQEQLHSDAGIQDAFFDSLSDGALITDPAGRPVAANVAYQMLAPRGVGAGVRGVEHLFSGNPDASDAVYRLASAAEAGRRGAEEIRMPAGIDGRADGARWYRVRVNPLGTAESEGGNPGVPGAGSSGTFSGGYSGWLVTDITREREHQENIFQELQNAIDYLDHAPAGFFSLDPDGRIRYLNATLAEWLGIDLAEFEPGQVKIGDHVSAESLPALDAAGRAGTGAVPARLDIDLVRRDGTRMPVSLLHRVPVASDGQIGASRTLVLDSHGAGDPQGGRLAQMRFNRFFNNSPMAIASVDREGRIGLTNARFVMLFGPVPTDAGKPNILDLVLPGGRSALAGTLAAAVSGQDDIPAVDLAFGSTDKAAAGRSGSGDGIPAAPERSARFFVSPILDHGEGEDAAIVYAMETTEQRALEAQFAQSQKMQAVGQLAGGIAHDFNNVLTAIIGFSDLLLSSHRPSDPSFQDIMNIKQNAIRAAGLVRQLLAFSRRQTLRPKVVELPDVLSDLSVLLDRLLGEKVALVVDHDRDLWPIKADINQLEQVIVNLAVNARDAMPDGGTLTISTTNITEADSGQVNEQGFRPGEYVSINVVDTGTGMPPEIVEKIFEPFYSTKDVGKGTGLGLSTVYGIVKQTGGYIYVDSMVGEGTSFRVLFPRHIPDPSDEKAEPEVAAPAIPTDLTGSARILLVEDEEAVRAFAVRALAARGYEVHEAESGIDALDVISKLKEPIDLVVSDVVMPEMDGPTLLRELRKTQPDLKIIFVSGYAEEAFAKHLPDDESFQFLPKPFTLKELATAVKQTLAL